MLSSNVLGINVNAANMNNNTPTTHCFNQQKSSISNSITSTNPSTNTNLLHQHTPQMVTKPNDDSNPTCNELSNQVHHNKIPHEQNTSHQNYNNSSNAHESNVVTQNGPISHNGLSNDA